MKITERDAQILLHLVKYTREIQDTIHYFAGDKNRFMHDHIFRNAVSMPLMQIGELAKRLLPGFTNECASIAWSQIIGMRNFFAHDYEGMNAEKIWDSALEDAPVLQRVCESILQENGIHIPPANED